MYLRPSFLYGMRDRWSGERKVPVRRSSRIFPRRGSIGCVLGPGWCPPSPDPCPLRHYASRLTGRPSPCLFSGLTDKDDGPGLPGTQRSLSDGLPVRDRTQTLLRSLRVISLDWLKVCTSPPSLFRVPRFGPGGLQSLCLDVLPFRH